MTFYADARYLGNIEPRVDPNFYPIRGQRHPLEIRQSRLSGRVKVTRVHGFEDKPVHGSTITYDNMLEFLLDWADFNIRVVQETL